jgi:hypothetical protein
MLRKRIGYRNLVVSDDLEMGGVLSAAPVGEAAVEFVRAGGDLCLICHREDHVLQAHEALLRAAEQDSKFARRVAGAAGRVAAFKRKSKVHSRAGAPAPHKHHRKRWSRNCRGGCGSLESKCVWSPTVVDLTVWRSSGGRVHERNGSDCGRSDERDFRRRN